ncbi:16S rRNA pseudouridine(516) synthase RsuA [Cellvibrio polysaccharolyticus]|uniref:Pseudouridine synthase n=1 Tax=Cellvibrio polysaccharolyticus TaxID=2082724 RepID=A0A928V6R0_9GAMM|nr:16S rRNA pseudouridine(516) synthase RsuA [Cellvibrio polysaccharolyticus]MBE8717677.1 16S rRNA pseudouridine(516) synthase RsuA [Cellvibrio polysaccharolyticus]
MRLDKFIGNNSDYSRKQIQYMARQSRIRVNGVVEKNTAYQIAATDQISVDDTPVQAAGLRYFMLHKPAGVICANTDPAHPTVIDLLDMPRKSELQIAGRLDGDTTGLVLITDDGQWNHRVTAPTRACKKRYRVTTTEAIDEALIDLFKQGVQLHNEKDLTLPAELTILNSHEALLEIQEGRYHQVKRMFAAAGNHVVALHRESVGAILLDPQLAPGQYRPLTAEEIASI